MVELTKLERSGKIKENAFTFNAILITGNKAMKAFAKQKVYSAYMFN
jgi:hypothetical protein